MSTADKTGLAALHGWDQTQAEKAAQSLLTYLGKKREGGRTLFEDDDEMLYLQVSLKTVPLGPRRDTPRSVNIPNPLYTTTDTSICLFVKDKAGEGHRDAKDRMAKFQKNGKIAKIVGLSKLRTKYESYEAKRKLCAEYDLFLADNRILHKLPKLIGKTFFKKKKQPVPVNLAHPDWPAQIARACKATHFFQPTGNCLNIKIALSSFTPQQIAQNIHAALPVVAHSMPKKWANIQGVFLKTAESVALPIYQTLPDAPQKIEVAPFSAAGKRPITVGKETTAGTWPQPTARNGPAVTTKARSEQTGAVSTPGKEVTASTGPGVAKKARSGQTGTVCRPGKEATTRKGPTVAKEARSEQTGTVGTPGNEATASKGLAVAKKASSGQTGTVSTPGKEVTASKGPAGAKKARSGVATPGKEAIAGKRKQPGASQEPAVAKKARFERTGAVSTPGEEAAPSKQKQPKASKRPAVAKKARG